MTIRMDSRTGMLYDYEETRVVDPLTGRVSYVSKTRPSVSIPQVRKTGVAEATPSVPQYQPGKNNLLRPLVMKPQNPRQFTMPLRTDVDIDKARKVAADATRAARNLRNVKTVPIPSPQAVLKEYQDGRLTPAQIAERERRLSTTREAVTRAAAEEERKRQQEAALRAAQVTIPARPAGPALPAQNRYIPGDNHLIHPFDVKNELTNARIDELLDPARKLTKDEIAEASRIIDGFYERYIIGNLDTNPEVGLSSEVQVQFGKIRSLAAKASAGTAGATGVQAAFGGEWLEQVKAKNIAAALRQDPNRPDAEKLRGQLAELTEFSGAQTQHPVAYMVGRTAGEGIKYAVGAHVINAIPGVSTGVAAAGEQLSGMVGGKVSAEVMTRLLSGRVTDLPFDVINAAMETDNAEDFAKNLGVNTAFGLATDVGFELIGAAWRAIRKGIQSGTVRAETPDAAEMRQIMAEEFNGGNAIRENYDPQIRELPRAKQKTRFMEQVNDVMHGENPTYPLTVGDTPDVLKNIGASDRIMTMNPTTVRKIAYPEGYMGGKHNLGFYALEHLHDQLENPVAVLRSATQKDSLVIFTEFLDASGNPVMVPIHLDKAGRLGITNEIASMYGRGDFEQFISRQRELGNIIFEDEKRTLQQLPRAGLQLPGVEAASDPIYSIPRSAEKSNTNLLDQLAVEQPKLRPEDPIVRSINDGFGGHSVGAAESAYPGTQKVSRVRSNTIENSPMFSTAEKELMNPSEFKYNVVSEKQSMKEAAQRLQVDFDGEVKTLFEKQAFDGTDVDTAFGILEKYRQEARGLPADSPEQRRVIEWVKQIQEKGTEAGQRVQAFAKYSRTPEGAAVKAQKVVADEFKKLQNTDPNLVKAMDDLADKLAKIASEYEHDLPANPQEAAAKLRRVITELSGDKAYKRLGIDDEFIDAAVKSLQEGRAGKDYFADVLKEFEGIPALTSGEIIDIMDIMAQAEKLPQFSKERFEIEKQAYKIVADKFNASFMDKWNAWRYMAMLGNPRTHIRNMVGNTVFGGVTRIKNDIGAILEAGADKISRIRGNGGIDRTKSLLNPFNVRDNALKEAARGDYNTVYSLITGGGKYNPSRVIEDQKTVFDTKWLEWLRKKNLDALELEDSFALKSRYTENLSRFLKANGLDAGAFASADKEVLDILDAGRAYAIEEAQKATFRDANALASWLSNVSNSFRENGTISGKIGSAMIEGAVPFKKTPANIVKRGVEYSPVGILKSIYDGMKSIRKGSVSASKVIDELAAGLTGTGIMALGGFLASQGLLTGGGSEDGKERGFDALRGNQNYALKIGNKSYTLDWAAPAALPLFVGVEAYNDWKSAHEFGEFPDLVDSLTQITQPVLEMTMLQGLNDMIKSAKYSDGSELASIGTGALTNLATQGIPTVFGQVARAVDPLRRTIYNDPNSKIPGTNIRMPDVLSTTLQKSAAKIPGISTYLQPRTDQWGRTQENTGGGFLGRLAYNMLSPGYYSETRETPADTLLDSLYQKTSDASLLPSSAQKSFAVDGKKIRLTGKEYTKANQTRGQTANEIIGSLGESPTFRALSTEDQQKIITDAYAYATALGKEAVSQYEPEGWIEKAKNAEMAGIPVERYILYKNAFGDLEGYERPDGTYVSKQDQQAKMLLDDVTLTEKQKNLLDELMISDVTVMPREVHRDYSSSEALAFSELSEAAKAKYPRLERFGWAKEKYARYYKIAAQQKKEREVKQDLIAAGLSPQEATQIYSAVKRK